MRERWQGKITPSYRIACWNCHAEDGKTGQRSRAVAMFLQLGWKQIRRHWYCPDCALTVVRPSATARWGKER